MAKTVEFWFDVGSPYSYLAYKALPVLAARHGATIEWHPMLLGGVFRATSNQSPAMVPAKGRWMNADLQRWARRFDVKFAHNPHFPINTLVLMRGATGVLMRKGQAAFERYLAAIFDAMWAEPRNLGDEAELARVLRAAGFDPGELAAIANEPEVKEKLKSDTEAAVARGVFGAPSFFVGDELFWGQDRLDFVAEALDRA